MATIPILWNHNHATPIGHVKHVGDKLMFVFNEDVRVSEQAMFEIFGNCGVRVLHSQALPDGTRLIRSGEILEFSFGTP